MALDLLNLEVVACRRCPRLVAWREKVAREKRRATLGWEYWGKPVPGFGDPDAKVFVVGLAPGAHGSNRTGRQFTGDASGDFLYPALYRAGFASQPSSVCRDDGLTLINLYTAPICRCVPPDNQPTLEEMNHCQSFLEREIAIIQPEIFVALGRIAFKRLMVLFPRNRTYQFSHGATYRLNTEEEIPGAWLICSYHPSRQNTQTGLLTTEMFDTIWKKVRMILDTGKPK